MGYEVLPRNNLTLVMSHLAEKGPLGVAVAASPWKDYVGGVFDGCQYDENIVINHAVQVSRAILNPSLIPLIFFVQSDKITVPSRVGNKSA